LLAAGSGGTAGRPIELVIRDTAADPDKAAAAVDELTSLGVTAFAGEYHSVVARTIAAKADALCMPFLCSSAERLTCSFATMPMSFTATSVR
jgi:ABC-type branched-subunit amino acid transport system substrate-binding protein